MQVQGWNLRVSASLHFEPWATTLPHPSPGPGTEKGHTQRLGGEPKAITMYFCFCFVKHHHIYALMKLFCLHSTLTLSIFNISYFPIKLWINFFYLEALCAHSHPRMLTGSWYFNNTGITGANPPPLPHLAVKHPYVISESQNSSCPSVFIKIGSRTLHKYQKFMDTQLLNIKWCTAIIFSSLHICRFPITDGKQYSIYWKKKKKKLC